MLHPELELLERRYLELVQAVNAGHLSQDDALATLANVTAVDGEGATWSVDPYSGQFVRAFPGAAPTPANPASFTPSLLPPPPMQPGPDGGPAHVWGAPPSLTPPAGPPAARVALSTGGAAVSGIAGRVKGLVEGRTRTLVVVGAAVVAVIVMFVALSGRSGGEAPTAVGPVAASEGPADATGPINPTEQPGPIPSEKELAGFVDAFTSGSTKQLLPLMPGVPSKPDALLSLAGLSGAKKMGFGVTPAGASYEGQALIVRVNVSASGKVRAVFEVPMQQTDAGWVIVAPARVLPPPAQ